MDGEYWVASLVTDGTSLFFRVLHSRFLRIDDTENALDRDGVRSCHNLDRVCT